MGAGRADMHAQIRTGPPAPRLSRRRFVAAGATGALLAAAQPLLSCVPSPEPAPTATATPPSSGNSAQRAVTAARAFSGTTIRVGWESGLQAQDLILFGAPEWERLTGIHVQVIELGLPSAQYRRIISEFEAGASALDCFGIAPAWLPDLTGRGALAPLDGYIAAYMRPDDLNDYPPLYRDLGKSGGHTYGLFDDGDVLLLYHRTDLFDSPTVQSAFSAEYGRPLGDPSRYDWSQFRDAARFFSDHYSPRIYGLAPFSRELRWGWFQALLRANGGQYFDPQTMRSEVNAEPGIRAMNQLVELDTLMPPDCGDVADPAITISTYLSGTVAMASFWPPLGRWAEGYGLGEPPLASIPPTQVRGLTGYGLLPGNLTELAIGFLLAVSSQSRNAEAAYLFIQWLSSPETSLRRVMLPTTLRDPYRNSHYASPEYRGLWPSAPEYLDTLRAATGRALLDLILPGANDYAEAFAVAATNARLGTPVPAVMNQMAAAWDAITDRIGRDQQRAAYREYLDRPGATIHNFAPLATVAP
jgi:multiple sugar transport system substrate-binding protein